MRAHQRKFHFKEEDHICQDCAKEFDSPSEFKRHRRIHTGSYHIFVLLATNLLLPLAKRTLHLKTEKYMYPSSIVT